MIGVIGLGAMGSVMARRLVQSQPPVVVCDVNPAAVDALVADGAIAADSPKAVANLADVVLLSLPGPTVARQVVGGTDGLLAASGGALTTIVDTSTVGGTAAREIAASAALANVGYVDAPVTGGVRGAVAGTLVVMASGADAAVDRARPALEAISSSVIVVGQEPGQAQVAKLANNLLSASAMLLSAEAVLMSVKAGIDPAVVMRIMARGTGRNSAVEEKFPKFVLTRGFDSQFRLDLIAKDLRLCLEAAAALQVPMLAGRQVEQLFSLCEAVAEPGADSTEIVRLLEGWCGVRIDDMSWRERLQTTGDGR